MTPFITATMAEKTEGSGNITISIKTPKEKKSIEIAESATVKEVMLQVIFSIIMCPF